MYPCRQIMINSLSRAPYQIINIHLVFDSSKQIRIKTVSSFLFHLRHASFILYSIQKQSNCLAFSDVNAGYFIWIEPTHHQSNGTTFYFENKLRAREREKERMGIKAVHWLTGRTIWFRLDLQSSIVASFENSINCWEFLFFSDHTVFIVPVFRCMYKDEKGYSNYWFNAYTCIQLFGLFSKYSTRKKGHFIPTIGKENKFKESHAYTLPLICSVFILNCNGSTSASFACLKKHMLFWWVKRAYHSAKAKRMKRERQYQIDILL